jgi:hypothetical protein
MLPPARFCRQLLATLEASEGRRKRRKRNTTPDAIGMALKRDLLEQTVQAAPDPEAFEGWLLQYCQTVGMGDGPIRAMALDVLSEWRLAAESTAFQQWLDQGAPSDDTRGGHEAT